MVIQSWWVRGSKKNNSAFHEWNLETSSPRKVSIQAIWPLDCWRACSISEILSTSSRTCFSLHGKGYLSTSRWNFEPQIKRCLVQVAAVGTQYAEVLVSGKTKPRTLPLIDCIPYIKEWMQNHPAGSNPESWLFVSLSKTNFGQKLSRDGCLSNTKTDTETFFFLNCCKMILFQRRARATLRICWLNPGIYMSFDTPPCRQNRRFSRNTLYETMQDGAFQVRCHKFTSIISERNHQTCYLKRGIVKHDEKKSNILRLKRCQAIQTQEFVGDGLNVY